MDNVRPPKAASNEAAFVFAAAEKSRIKNQSLKPAIVRRIMADVNPQAGNQPNPTPPAGDPPANPAPAAATPPEPDNSVEALQGKLDKSVQAEKNLRARLKEAEEAEKKCQRHLVHHRCRDQERESHAERDARGEEADEERHRRA